MTIRHDRGDAVGVPVDSPRRRAHDAADDITVIVERMDGGPRLVIEQAQDIPVTIYLTTAREGARAADRPMAG